MNAPVAIKYEQLTTLIQRAADALLSAKTSAEVLDARDFASVAYDAAKSAGRMARIKTAHDSILAEVYRAQADALLIEARAKMRLADEYDAAVDRGDMAGHGGARNFNLASGKVEGTAAEVGLSYKQIHEARGLRDSEQSEPGLAERALTAMLERGEEPTKAALRREMAPDRKPQRVMDAKALWLWGRLKDFERNDILSADIDHLLNEMTPPMREDVARLAPLVAAYLERI